MNEANRNVLNCYKYFPNTKKVLTEMKANKKSVQTQLVKEFSEQNQSIINFLPDCSNLKNLNAHPNFFCIQTRS